MKLIYRIIFLLLLLFTTIIIKDEPELAYFILGAVVVAYSLLLILQKNPEEAMFYKKSIVLTVDLFALMLIAPYLILSAILNTSEYQFSNLFISIIGGAGVFLLLKAAWFDSLNVGFNDESIIVKSIFKTRIINFCDIKKAQIVAQKHSATSKFLLRASGTTNPAFIKQEFAEANRIIPAVKITLLNEKSFYFNIQTSNPSQMDFVDFFENQLKNHGIQISDEVIQENVKYFDAEFTTSPRRTFLTFLMSFIIFEIITIICLMGQMAYKTYKHPPVKINPQIMIDYKEYKKLTYSKNIIDKSITNFNFPNIGFEINFANDNYCGDIAINNSIYVLLSQSAPTSSAKFLIVQLDKNGKVIKQKKVGSAMEDYVGNIKLVDKDNILLTGISYVGRPADSRAVIFIHKLDKNLNTIWKKTINEFQKYSFLEIFDVDYKNDEQIDLLLKSDYSPSEKFRLTSPEKLYKNAILMQVGKSNKITVLDSNRYYQNIKFNNNLIIGVLNMKKILEVNYFNRTGKLIKHFNNAKESEDFIYKMLIADDGNLIFIGGAKTASSQKSILFISMLKSGKINFRSSVGLNNLMGTAIIKTNDGYTILASPYSDPEVLKQDIYFNITRIDNSFKETYTRNFKKSDNEIAGLRIVSSNNSLFILGDKTYIKDERISFYKTLLKVKME